MKSDDRITCPTCSEFRVATGACLAAKRMPDVGNKYHPVSELPRRCEFYLPRKGVEDQRPGVERWTPPMLRRKA